VVEVRRRIVLEDHEAIVLKDRTGRYIIRRGTDEERSFFLDPYSELVTLHWSTGIHKDQRNLKITKLDLRPKFMWYEFEARTQDNVEIVIGITFFWEVIDFEAMIRVTDDAPGDICSHARSAIIQAVSQVTLEIFLASFNAIIHEAVLDTDAPFYTERGVRLNAVEVRSVSCKDPETQRVLQEIIMETTNRLKRRQKQESDNEVKVKEIKGQVEAEAVRGQLLKLRQEHERIEALSLGEAEAVRVRAFFEGVGDDLPAVDKVALFNTLRKHDSLTKLSQGRAQLYFTPAEVDLSIESRSEG
jgi:regulator of protease activity HflC (stomatin/prohibitin superfamily)